MPPCQNRNSAFCIKNRSKCLHSDCQSRFGKYQIQISQLFNIVAHFAHTSPGQIAQFLQNTGNLPLFLLFQQAQMIIRLHYPHRLNKQCRSTGGLPMDQPGNLSTVLLLDRHYKTPFPHGDDSFLQIGCLFFIAQNSIQLFTDLRIFAFDLAANISQFRRSIIRHFFFTQNRLLNTRNELVIIPKLLCHFRQPLHTGSFIADNTPVRPFGSLMQPTYPQ